MIKKLRIFKSLPQIYSIILISSRTREIKILFIIKFDIKWSSISHRTLSRKITIKWSIWWPISSISSWSSRSFMSSISYPRHSMKWCATEVATHVVGNTSLQHCRTFPHPSFSFQIIFDKMNYFRLHNNLS